MIGEKLMYYDTKESGKRMKESRIKKGYTQAELSAIIGMGENSIARIESGIRGTSIDSILLFAEALEESVDYLLTGKR